LETCNFITSYNIANYSNEILNVLDTCNFITSYNIANYSNEILNVLETCNFITSYNIANYSNEILNVLDTCNFITSYNIAKYSNEIFNVLDTCNFITSYNIANYSNEILNVLNTCNFITSYNITNYSNTIEGRLTDTSNALNEKISEYSRKTLNIVNSCNYITVQDSQSPSVWSSNIDNISYKDVVIYDNKITIRNVLEFVQPTITTAGVSQATSQVPETTDRYYDYTDTENTIQQISFPQDSICDILIVGGGGSGSIDGGGGSSGGVLYAMNQTIPKGTYEITVGKGGVDGNGGDSSAFGATAKGGLQAGASDNGVNVPGDTVAIWETNSVALGSGTPFEVQSEVRQYPPTPLSAGTNGRISTGTTTSPSGTPTYGNGDYIISWSSAYDTYYTTPLELFTYDDTLSAWQTTPAMYDSDSYKGSASLNGISGEWFTIELPVAIYISYIKYTSYAFYAPSELKVFGSNDNGTNWVEIIHKIDITDYENVETNDDDIVDNNNNNAYSLYGVVIPNLIYDEQWNTRLKLNNFKFYGTKDPNVVIPPGGGGISSEGESPMSLTSEPKGGSGLVVPIRTPDELFAGGGGANGGLRVPSENSIGYGGNSTSTTAGDGGDGVVIVRWKSYLEKQVATLNDITTTSNVIEGRLTATSNVIEGRLTATSNTIEGRLTATSNVIEGRITATSNVIEGRLTNTSNTIEERITATSNTIEQRITATSNVIEGRLTDTSNVIEGRITTTFNAIERHIAATSNAIEGRLIDTSNTLNENISEYNLKTLNIINSCNYITIQDAQPVSVWTSNVDNISYENVIVYNDNITIRNGIGFVQPTITMAGVSQTTIEVPDTTDRYYDYTYTESGTQQISFHQDSICDILIVGGGGSGRINRGGGSSGGILYAMNQTIPKGTYVITVGQGGVDGNGGDSSAFGATAKGGLQATTATGATNNGSNIKGTTVATWNQNKVALAGGTPFANIETYPTWFPREAMSANTKTYTFPFAKYSDNVVRVKASSMLDSDYDGFRAFDDDETKGWISTDSYQVDSGGSYYDGTTHYAVSGYYGEYIMVDLGEHVIISEMHIYNGTTISERHPRNYKLYGTNDVSDYDRTTFNWTEIYEKIDTTITPPEITIDYLNSNTLPFRYYALVINKIFSTSTNLCMIHEIRWFGKQVEYTPSGGGGIGSVGESVNGGNGFTVPIRTLGELFAGGGGANGGKRVPETGYTIGYGGNSTSTIAENGGDGVVIVRWKSYVEKQVATFNDIVATSNVIENRITDTSNTIEGRLIATSNTIEERITATSNTIEERITATSNKIEERITATSNKIEERITATSNTIEGRITATSNTIEGRITATSNTIEGRLTDTSKAIEGRITATSNTIEGRLTDTSNTIEGRLTDTSNTIEGRITATSNTIEGRLTDTFNTIEGRLTDTSNTIEGRLTDTSNTIEGRLTDTSNQIFSYLTSLNIANYSNQILNVMNTCNYITSYKLANFSNEMLNSLNTCNFITTYNITNDLNEILNSLDTYNYITSHNIANYSNEIINVLDTCNFITSYNIKNYTSEITKALNTCNYITSYNIENYASEIANVLNTCNYITSYNIENYADEITKVLNTCNYITSYNIENYSDVLSSKNLIINDGKIHIGLDMLLEQTYISSISKNSNIELSINNSLETTSYSYILKKNKDPSGNYLIKKTGTASYKQSFFVNNGFVYSCGNNKWGQLGNGIIADTNNPFPSLVLLSTSVPLTDIIQVSVGNTHTIFLKNTGIAFGCGDNGFKQLGIGDIQNSKYASQVLSSEGTPMTKISQVSCGQDFSVFLLSTGFAFSIGYNYYGQLGNGDFFGGPVYPTEVLSALNTPMTDISYIATNTLNSFFVKSSGVVFGCGINQGILGNNSVTATIPEMEDSSRPTIPPPEYFPSAVLSNDGTALGNISEVSVDENLALFLANDGKVFYTEQDYSSPFNDSCALPVLFNDGTPLTDIKKISCSDTSIFLKHSGVAFYSYNVGNSNLNLQPIQSSDRTPMTDITSISSSSSYSIIVQNDDKYYTFVHDINIIDNNTYGNLGNGTTIDSIPGTLSEVSLLKYDNRDALEYLRFFKFKYGFYDYITNTYFKFGSEPLVNDIDYVNYDPKILKKITKGFKHAIVLTTTFAFSWGSNSFGQRGRGDIVDVLSITNDMYYVIGPDNSPIRGVKNIACGNFHSVFLIEKDAYNDQFEGVYTCGFNSSGQLGDTTTNNSSILLKVSITSTIDNIFAGGNASFFVSTSMVYATGYNEQGQLGIGTIENTSTPTSVQGVDGIGTLTASIKDIRVGNRHVMFLTTEGVGYASGSNDVNQLGVVQSITLSYVPVVIQELSEDGYNSRPITKPIQKIYTDSLSDKSILIF